MCVEREHVGVGGGGGRGRHGKEEGRTGKGAPRAMQTGLGMVSVLQRTESWRLEALCGQCCTKSSVRRKDTA